MKKSMAGLGTAALALGGLGAVLVAPGPASAVTPTVSEVTFTGEMIAGKITIGPPSTEAVTEATPAP